MITCSAVQNERLRRATKLLCAASIDINVAMMSDFGELEESHADEAAKIFGEIGHLVNRIDALHAALTACVPSHLIDTTFGSHPRRRVSASEYFRFPDSHQDW